MFEITVGVFSLQVALVKRIPTNDLLNMEQHFKRANVGPPHPHPSTIDLNEGNMTRILEPAVGCTCEKT